LENSPAKILIIDTAWLGDVVFTTALMGAVRKQWPSACVDLVVAPRAEPIVRDHPFLRRLWVYDKRDRERSLMALVRLGRRLKRERYDAVFCAHPSLRSRVLTLLSGSPVRVGYKGFGSSVCFTRAIPNDLAVVPDHAQRRLNLLRALGVPGSAEPLFVGMNTEGRLQAEDLLARSGISERRMLGLICGSAWRTKRWRTENFAELGTRWVAETGGAVLVFGGKAERESVNRICAAVGSNAISVIQEPLPLVFALLARCETVVGNDTGLSFLAIAAGCPRVLVLYGSTQVNYAFPTPHRAIIAGVPCCLRRTGHGAQHCKWSHEPWCMAQISDERVWNAIKP
jgi:lipopolysaccharide heptosyltransferase II